MPLKEVNCTKCGDPIAFAATTCTGCGYQDVGYPNVRYANDPMEVSALDRRVAQAFELASMNGSAAALSEFEQTVASSSAITVMGFADLRLILCDNRLWVSFYKQTRSAGSRVAQRNKWDMNRDANDGKVNPQYYEEINYAALSLSDHGCGWYGGCHITLKGDRIEKRASVFWENPVLFLKHLALGPDDGIPPGYRASWERRARLAAAKLHSKITVVTKINTFPDILLERDPDRGDTDFIEVHIYGPIAPSAFAMVAIDKTSLDQDDMLEWESVKRRLQKLGIPVRETDGA